MNNKQRFVLGLFLFFTCFSSASVMAANPIVTDIYTADPSVHYFEGKYWVYTTHDEPTASFDFDMRDWRVYSSTDLKEWTDHGVVMHIKDIAWAKRDAWAVDVVERNGIFYMYFPVDKEYIGVATSTSPEGPFRDALGHPLVSRDMKNVPYLTIDPTVLIDDDGEAYLYLGNDDPIAAFVMGGDPAKARKTPRVVKLKPNMVELDGEILDLKGINNFFEAPYIHKHNGVYYFSYAGNGPFSTISYATADNPLGPFTMRGDIADRLKTPLSMTNHHSIIERDGQSYFFYHTTDLSNGHSFRRSVAIDKMHYNADGTIQKVRRTAMGVGDVLRINAGEIRPGYHFTDSMGALWYKDGGHNDKRNIFVTNENIQNTDDDSIYQSQRSHKGLFGLQAPLRYRFFVDNGTYEIKLHFAETYFIAPGKRVFDINAEGQKLYAGLDIYEEAGQNTALIKTFNVNVGDGTLNIDFIPKKNHPMVAGIEILKR